MIYNQLSYSNLCTENLASIVRKSLLDSGVPESQLNRFDSDSAITIRLDNDISLKIAVLDDRLWLWSPISISIEEFQRKSNSILNSLTTPIPHVETGHLILGQKDNQFELKALLNIESVNNGYLPAILSDFYQVALTIAE